MASSQSFPSTDKAQVMVYAVAWEIMEKTIAAGAYKETNRDEYLEKITNDFLRVYQSIWTETPIAKE